MDSDGRLSREAMSGLWDVTAQAWYQSDPKRAQKVSDCLHRQDWSTLLPIVFAWHQNRRTQMLEELAGAAVQGPPRSTLALRLYLAWPRISNFVKVDFRSAAIGGSIAQALAPIEQDEIDHIFKHGSALSVRALLGKRLMMLGMLPSDDLIDEFADTVGEMPQTQWRDWNFGEVLTLMRARQLELSMASARPERGQRSPDPIGGL